MGWIRILWGYLLFFRFFFFILGGWFCFIRLKERLVLIEIILLNCGRSVNFVVVVLIVGLFLVKLKKDVLFFVNVGLIVVMLFVGKDILRVLKEILVI